jgi:hypothetical protein
VEDGRLHATLGSAGSRAPSLSLTAGSGAGLELLWISADGRRVLRSRLASLGPAAPGHATASPAN